MPTLATIEVHSEVTARNEYRYQFTPKHHGADKTASQWLPSLSLEAEFAVFNLADEHELFDEGRRLYGIQRDSKDGLSYLGTYNQPFQGDDSHAFRALAPLF